MNTVASHRSPSWGTFRDRDGCGLYVIRIDLIRPKALSPEKITAAEGDERRLCSQAKHDGTRDLTESNSPKSAVEDDEIFLQKKKVH